jgi:hypothetical protein
VRLSVCLCDDDENGGDDDARPPHLFSLPTPLSHLSLTYEHHHPTTTTTLLLYDISPHTECSALCSMGVSDIFVFVADAIYDYALAADTMQDTDEDDEASEGDLFRIVSSPLSPFFSDPHVSSPPSSSLLSSPLHSPCVCASLFLS